MAIHRSESFGAARVPYRTTFICLAALFTCTAPSAHGEDKLPSGAEVLDRYIEVTGGAAAYTRVKSSVVRGTFKMSMMTPITATLEVWSQAPNLRYTRVAGDEQFGVMERGSDGTSAWEIHPRRGPRLLEGEERDEQLFEALFYRDVDWKNTYTRVENTGREDFEGRVCYRVELEPKHGTKRLNYYDCQTGLLAGSERTMQFPGMGEVVATTFIDEYKEYGGIRQPSITTVVMGPIEQRVLVESVEYDVDIPQAKFAVPEAVTKAAREARNEQKVSSSDDAGE